MGERKRKKGCGNCGETRLSPTLATDNEGRQYQHYVCGCRIKTAAEIEAMCRPAFVTVAVGSIDEAMVTIATLRAELAALTAEREAMAHVIDCGRKLHEIPEDPAGKRLAWQTQADDAGRFALFFAAMRDVTNLHDAVHRIAREAEAERATHLADRAALLATVAEAIALGNSALRIVGDMDAAYEENCRGNRNYDQWGESESAKIQAVLNATTPIAKRLAELTVASAATAAGKGA